MSEEKRDYVVYSMRAKCSEGTMENYISTDVGHGVTYQGQPLLNANDHTKQVNLTHFGDCNAKMIYEEAKKQADEKYKADADDGFFAKAGKWFAKTVTKAKINVQEHLMFHKCELDTPLPWMFCNEEHMIDGAPALTMESQCPCRMGGIITIVPVIEEEAKQQENVELEQVNDLVTEYEDVLREQHGSLIQQYYSDDPNIKADAEDKMKDINIMEVLHDLGNQINSMPYIQNNKNEIVSWIDLVNTGQPLDLKGRKQEGEDLSIWSLPWGDGNGGTITNDYSGNWLYGYVGAEYFSTFADDAILKYGAGLAQLLHDSMMEIKEDATVEKAFSDYRESMLSGGYGDNLNEGGKNDSDMIQDGVDAYRKEKSDE